MCVICCCLCHAVVSDSFCNRMDCSPPGSSVHGMSQARILEWVAFSFSRGSFQPRDQTQVSCVAGGFFTSDICAVLWVVAQLCPILCDSMDDSPPGSSVHRIFQARILKWVAISFSRVCVYSLFLMMCMYIYLST